MLADPGFAQRVIGGGAAAFAAHERDVMARTNALAVRGRCLAYDAPWPRFFGTSPWGAWAELERGTGRPYVFRLVRAGSPPARAAALSSVMDSVAPQAPALLYVGDRWLPRHVTLVFASGGERLIYEPARGAVLNPSIDVVVDDRLALAGWNVPWFALVPEAE
ncbi:hypothetical protein [Gephyromycinifex aptenodytis]|uniref:hypothetical protein n=1 Tax=Gephyromycinifex aptenodytis TaxID=2716227 RepID=UPI0014466889|nr:hypothetical protein [Gephyromycinifex aptenodytis]